MSNAKVVMSQAANTWAGPTYIEDVFSTYLYTGNGSTQTITNGIDLAGEGGLVWIKKRGGIQNHCLQDTEQGITKYAPTNATSAFNTSSTRVTSTSASGFSISNDSEVNENAFTYASWTWRKAPRWFDVVTYTGNGNSAGQTISHNLGHDVGFITIKKTSAAGNWAAWHRANGNNTSMYLNTTGASFSYTGNIQSATSTTFTIGNDTDVNASGATYVAYLFAHDPLGPSGDGSDGLIACGSFSPTVIGQGIDLGWEPQWVLIKNASGTGGWAIRDIMRGITTGGIDADLYANNSNAESNAAQSIDITPRGFTNNFTTTGGTYIYIAIRRGPMRQPTSGTEVFSATAYTSNNADNRLVDTGILTDLAIAKIRNVSRSEGFKVADRMRGDYFLGTAVTTAELYDADTFMTPTSGVGNSFSTMVGFGVGNDLSARLNYGTTEGVIAYAFKRAPGFFDVVAYTGGSPNNKQIAHNLGVVPELIIQKQRSGVANWHVWCGLAGQDFSGRLNLSNPFDDQTGPYYFGTHTDTYFSVGYTGYETNVSGTTNIAYLFATLPGVSKVGSYTGNGSSQTIDCGFTSGARFILIKRTDSTGDWYVWDTARGIVAANDPRMSLNSGSTTEVTTDDSVDPDSSGFIVNQVAATNINVSGGSYIYLAIA